MALERVGVSLYNPSAEQHTVVYVARNDPAEIELRRKNQFPLYPGNTSDAHMRSWRAEVALMYKNAVKTRGPLGSRPFIDIFSQLQNFGDSRKTWLQNMDSVMFGGITGTPTLVDSDNKDPYYELAALFGGTITILNTSTEVINAGQRIMWTLPKDLRKYLEFLRGMVGRPEGRIPIPIAPYRPDDQKLSGDLIRRFGLGEEVVRETDPVGQGAAGFLDASFKMMFLGALLNEAGVFGNANGDLRGVPTSMSNLTIALRNTVNSARTRNKVLRMAQALRLQTDLAPEDEDAWGDIPIRDFLVKLLLPRAQSDYIVPIGEENMIPTGIPGDIYRAQNDVVEQLLEGIASLNHFFTDKIFATAFSTAGPGKAIDIVIGRYGA